MKIKNECHLDREKIMSILNKITLFGGFEKNNLEYLLNNLSEIFIEKGEVIFKEGDSPTDIYIVLEGRAEFFLNGEKFLDIEQGFSMAETAVLGIQKHVFTAIAATDMELLVLSKQKLMELFHENKDVFSLLILNMARELARGVALFGDYKLLYTSIKNNKRSDK
ncbi:cyclic nucleotide-binding domain-containing protein [uncultured Ilyobacter sp.]|uniref:cyclic nucleotide-binding domain-containing protein n=1 Tax=uncultured Ilyobacter sp. TaxID=544433 RepID=UPI0029C84164|nr:cyclic nucleotide-binding domain-containing protein [uncultured Ilyobacter sp.]